MKQRLRFIQCNPGEPIPPQPTREEEDRDRDDEHARHEWLLEAAKGCRCDLLWSPCEGVLAGGVCDELYQDEYEAESWDDDANDPVRVARRALHLVEHAFGCGTSIVGAR
jgi:hypothetical protein